MDISELEVYRISAEKRHQENLRLIEERYQKAYSTAQKASELLKDQFKAERVLIFGSLSNKDRFHISSDIDLAAVGLDDKVYFRAISKLIDLSPGIKIDLIRIEDASEGLKNIINDNHIEL
jgi:uncharacterized protein